MSENKELTFGDFALEHAIFEARYPIAFLHADVGGSLWNDLEKSLPVNIFEVNELSPQKDFWTIRSPFQFGY